MVDGDAPTPQNPTSADIRHWAVADVSPSSSPTNYSSGNVLSAYRSPAPGAGSPAHRYTSVLLRQPAGGNVSLYNQSASISNFNLNLFIQQNHLTIVSANYFNASRTNSSSTTSSATGRASTGASTVVAASSSSSRSTKDIALSSKSAWMSLTFAIGLLVL